MLTNNLIIEYEIYWLWIPNANYVLLQDWGNFEDHLHLSYINNHGIIIAINDNSKCLQDGSSQNKRSVRIFFDFYHQALHMKLYTPICRFNCLSSRLHRVMVQWLFPWYIGYAARRQCTIKQNSERRYDQLWIDLV